MAHPPQNMRRMFFYSVDRNDLKSYNILGL